MKKIKLVLMTCVLALFLGLNLGGIATNPLSVDPPFGSTGTV